MVFDQLNLVTVTIIELEIDLLLLLSYNVHNNIICPSSMHTVQHDLADMNKNETQETVKQMASNISIPTLVLWGDHDKVS